MDQLCSLAISMRQRNNHWWSTKRVERLLDGLRCEGWRRHQAGTIMSYDLMGLEANTMLAAKEFAFIDEEIWRTNPGDWLVSKWLIPEPCMTTL